MKGIGLVLAGGGGKGSYEIGVWKYLHEIGLDQYVRAVSGTSVGALNAALFVGGSYELAERLWLTINRDKILTPRKISSEDIASWLVANGFQVAVPIAMGLGKAVSGVIVGTEKMAQAMLMKMRGDHMFSRDGIIDMISEGLCCNKLQTSDIPCYVTCVRCQGLEIERFKLNEYSEDEIITLLLASSAIPVIFENEQFRGVKYCDGGIPVVGDNVPVKPVYDTGVENIIVVHLSQDTTIDKEAFPDARIIEIVPREDLGNALTGTLDFSPEGASYRLRLGYEDAKKAMRPMVEMVKMTFENQRILMAARQKNIKYEEKRRELLKKEANIKEKMEKDGFDAVFSELMKEK